LNYPACSAILSGDIILTNSIFSMHAEMSVFKKFYMIFNFFIARRTVLYLYTFFFFIILLPMNIIFSEVQIRTWQLVYISWNTLPMVQGTVISKIGNYQKRIYVLGQLNIALVLTLLSWSLSGYIAFRFLLACTLWCLHVMTTYAEMIIFISFFFLSPSCI
jgi:hypothetical protein